MRVVDTSAWIEWLAGKPAGNVVRPLLPSVDDWLVPTIVQLELSKWLMRTVSRQMADQIILFSNQCLVVPLDTAIALRASEYCRAHKLATADAIVYATAVQHGADILTCDSHFSALPDVVFVPNRSS
ncbi:MAG: type II toxin-antitoxin system VapC family toxin [Rhizobiaceae bacterium]|nr:type II toxin-antitoxin system VapC family toxin [Rhizobiaceae bacterium]